MKKKYSCILRCLCALVLVMMMVLSGQAKDKVVESSASKRPLWVGVATPGYIAVSATASTMDEAQHRCMADIKQQIITSVAVNIVSNESYKTLQISENELINTFEDYSSQVNATGANLPFITGISISRAKEIYWEKHYLKNEKQYYYQYHVLYPFSDSERNKWIDEFLAQDKEQYDKYLVLKDKLKSVSDVESIAVAIGELSTLDGYFFDSRRSGEVRQLQNNYYKLYDQIVIEPVKEELGRVYYCLTIGSNIVTVSKIPRLKTKSAATELSVKQGDEAGLYVLTYNHENCYEEDDNSIEVSYTVGGKVIKKVFYFDVRENKMKVVPTGMVNINFVYGEENAVAGLRFEITFTSNYDNEFEIRYLTLNIPEYNRPVSGNFEDRFKGKGNHLLVFKYSDEELLKNFLETSRLSLLDGVVDVCNLKTGEVKAVPFKLPYRIKK